MHSNPFERLTGAALSMNQTQMIFKNRCHSSVPSKTCLIHPTIYTYIQHCTPQKHHVFLHHKTLYQLNQLEISHKTSQSKGPIPGWTIVNQRTVINRAKTLRNKKRTARCVSAQAGIDLILNTELADLSALVRLLDRLALAGAFRDSCYLYTVMSWRRYSCCCC